MINGVKPSPCIAKKNEGNVLLKLELHWFYSHYVYKYASYCVQFNSIELRAKMSSAAKCMQFSRIYNPLHINNCCSVLLKTLSFHAFFFKSEYLVKYIGEFNWSVTLSLFWNFLLNSWRYFWRETGVKIHFICILLADKAWIFFLLVFGMRSDAV